VTYVVNPTMDFPAASTVADHAYWLSGLKLRNSGGNAPLGQVDARSEGFGLIDPAENPTQTYPGTLEGGNLGPLSYDERRKSWDPPTPTAAHDVLHLDAQNLAQVIVHPGRARLSCHPQLDVTTDGPLTMKLAGCGRTLTFGGP
jgi:hypothetical protein